MRNTGDEHSDFAAPSAVPVAPASLPAVFVALLTILLWLGCSTVAIFGDIAPELPSETKKEAPPAPVLIHVALTQNKTPVLAANARNSQPANNLRNTAAARPASPFPALPAPTALPTNTLPPVSPLVALATPERAPSCDLVSTPTLPVASAPVTNAAGGAGSADAVTGDGVPGILGTPAVEQLVFGVGLASSQPAPDYPEASRKRGHTGTVRVRFDVAADGRVTAAEAVRPCRDFLLNDSAVSTIRRFWRFPSGRPRCYEVDIRFELQDFL
ncbi:MAG: TonB family protein [Puniceicoccales bacterium]|nr:TonB family protein [Puniceicoccales bacterium]